MASVRKNERVVIIESPMKIYVDTEIEILQDLITKLQLEITELKETNRLLGKQITVIKTQNEEIITDINIFKEGGNL